MALLDPLVIKRINHHSVTFSKGPLVISPQLVNLPDFYGIP